MLLHKIIRCLIRPLCIGTILCVSGIKKANTECNQKFFLLQCRKTWDINYQTFIIDVIRESRSTQ